MTDNTPNLLSIDDPFLDDGQAGEIGLWRAVLTQVLMDAGSNSQKREMQLNKSQAISWLTGTSADFFEVCTLADLDPDYVRERARYAMQNGCLWREYNPNSFKRPQEKNVRKLKADKQVETKSMPASAELLDLAELRDLGLQRRTA